MYRATTVNKYKDLIMAAQDYIFHHPETGCKEWKTGRYMEEAFEKLGYTLTRAESIPGFYTVLDTGREGPEVLILGELDSIICREHPCADRETGAVCLSHGADYMIENPELACVSSAAWQLEMPRLRNAISRYREYLKRLPTGVTGEGGCPI